MVNGKTCNKCNKSALYHDKWEQLFCEKCYWEKDEKTKIKAKKRSWKTYDSAPDTFINCPNCFCGDTCGYSYNRKELDCISKTCGLFHPEGKSNCIACKIEEERKREQERQQEDSKKDQERNKISEEIHLLVEKAIKDSRKFTTNDYQKIKNLQEQVKSLRNKIRNRWEGDEELQLFKKLKLETLENLEELVPKRIKIQKKLWKRKNLCVPEYSSV